MLLGRILDEVARRRRDGGDAGEAGRGTCGRRTDRGGEPDVSEHKADERRELLEAGWEPDDGEGGTIWRNPGDGNWYEQGRAVQILVGGGGAGQSD